MFFRLAICAALVLLTVVTACAPQEEQSSGIRTSSSVAELDRANPLQPLPTPPLGIVGDLASLENPPTAATVRLGRWIFYDPRISIDDTVSCATCHRPENGFSEPTAVSTGVGGSQGTRKAPPVLNVAFDIVPHRFWDGRAASLEEQAVGPMINPVEMAMPDHDVVLTKLRAIEGYGPYFEEAFGDSTIDLDRVAKALADYERTRFSGNSPWDRWRAEPDPEDASIDIDAVTDFDGTIHLDEVPFTDGKHVNAQVKLGHYVFHDKAACNQCHLGPNFTDALFHNVGVGWDEAAGKLKDEGRYVVTKEEADHGAFKTPTLREVTKRAPCMHDGSEATLRDVVELYNRGGNANPWLSPKMKPLDLSDAEIDALVAFMGALEGEGYQDTAPVLFPE